MTRSTFVIFIACLSLAGSGCKDSGADASTSYSITEDHSNIVDPEARWHAYRLSDYVLEQQRSCFCVPDGLCDIYVKNNVVVDVIRKQDGRSIMPDAAARYKTVEDLFALTRTFNPDSVASMTIEFDRRFGYPKLIAVDISAQMTDEEFAYQTSSVRRLTSK